ncbi:serine/threonine-protein phosphatase 2A 56 kDa regulatory subunit delta isoform-like isoform X1 [Oryzias melastigma]|uniref:serine/threonine-protein phosphatase 2A 56 kDa regulatory subunit delta isoform-like isoform X1 n=1 Tax=Oryzias melastigma TaxID=30732 RepID=UPI00168D44A9|nr:serine/threonine-protein phosphatase 2A 56 kDa regulatory subunit delta isoform-like isoform X1 [Oryzias melastigma]
MMRGRTASSPNTSSVCKQLRLQERERVCDHSSTSSDSGDLKMPHKSKKEKEKSGGKNVPADDQGSSKKVPPPAQLMRVKQPGSHSALKREKRLSTSTFPLSDNRELQKLPPLRGNRLPDNSTF